jgi:hypothetical protein
MSQLEPSYLRYIYDGLEKGDLHPDNAAALPEGMIGLYEAEFEENIPARERQKLLNTFAIWALLKKEVSAQFVAEILEVPTQEIIDFIATYSNWFTSPESGKYQLYHERLKVYLLQKLSEQEIATLHDKLVFKLEQALAEQKQDEFELYGLEFLSLHYFTTAMIHCDGTKLIVLSYGQNHWQRQLKLSKGFEWTKKSLKQVMTWASKFNDEEVIECGLQMVELHHQEQNNAPQIVALVAEGDIEAALKRIEAFGGNDKDGLQRKFILYMLCLMELTLLESKDKPFRKVAIVKILKHFEENIPTDHSVLNWDDFFPSYLMFLIICEISKLNLDYLIFYKNTKVDYSWINKVNFDSTDYLVLLINTIQFVKDEYDKSKILCSILIKLLKFENNDLIIEKLDDIKNIDDKCIVLVNFSNKLYKKNREKEAIYYLEKAYKNSIHIKHNFSRGQVLELISVEYANQNNIVEAIKVALEINIKRDKCKALLKISSELNNQGNNLEAENVLNKTLDISSEISDVFFKIQSLLLISTEQKKQGFYDDSFKIMEHVLRLTKKNDFLDESIYKDIVIELLIQGDIKKSIKTAKKIVDKSDKNIVLYEILINLIKEYKIKDALELVNEIDDYYYKCSALTILSSKYIEQGKINKSILLHKRIIQIAHDADAFKNSVFKKICNDYALDGQLEIIPSVILEQLISKKEDLWKHESEFKINLSSNFIKLNKLDNGINIAEGLINDKYRSYAHQSISEILANQGDITSAIHFVSYIPYFSIKISALVSISINFSKIGRQNDANKALQAAIYYFNDNKEKEFDNQKHDVSIELAKQNNFKLAEQICKDIDNDFLKISTLTKISSYYSLAEKGTEAKKIMEDAILIANQLEKSNEINNIATPFSSGHVFVEELNTAYKNISINLASQNNFKKSFVFANKIISLTEKISAFASISEKLAEVGDFVNASQSIKLALLNTKDLSKKSIALKNISYSLTAQGKIKDSIKIAQEITDEKDKSEAFKFICENLIFQDNYIKAFDFALKIEVKSIRRNFWSKLGEIHRKDKGFEFCIAQLKFLPNDEAMLFYKEGIINEFETYNIKIKEITTLLYLAQQDSGSLKHVLKKHVLNKLFFEEKYSTNILEKFNKVLNIQWAIDLKNQLPN